MAIFRQSDAISPKSGVSSEPAAGPSSDYDVVFMGSGHNGLVAAAYFARAGKKVLVLESKSYIGGGVVTRELTVPGFHHDEHSSAHVMIQANPLLAQDELELKSRFGLKYLFPEISNSTVFPDGTTLCTYRDIEKTCESIASVSPRDAIAYRKFAEMSMRLLPMAVAGCFTPPVPMGQFVAMLDQSEEGRDFFRMMQLSSLDIANKFYENDKVKIHLLRLISENLQFPDDFGTGGTFLLWPGLIHTYGMGQPVGGSGKLTEALAACIEAYGGTILCDRKVEKVITSNGRAIGLRTDGGEEYMGRDAVVAAIHPIRLDQFVDGVPEPVIARAKETAQSPFMPLVAQYAVSEIPQLRAGGDASKAVMTIIAATDNLSELLDDYSDLRRGRMPKRQLILCGSQSSMDTTRAPEGKTIWGVGTHGTYKLADGRHWDDIKEEVAQRAFDAASKHYTNLTPDKVLGKHVASPLDFERFSPNSFVYGDIHGAAPYFYQSQNHRPTPDLGNFTVPGVERLYLVGPFMHPGGGVTGGGRATAIKIFDDLGMNFESAVAS